MRGYAVRWAILLVCWLAVIIGVLGEMPGMSGHDQNLVFWSFVGGAVVARGVPWLWHRNAENPPPAVKADGGRMER